MTATHVEVVDATVVDASAAMRFGLGRAPELRRVFEDGALFAPDFFALDCANGVRRYVRAGEIQRRDGDELLGFLLSLRIELIPAARLAVAAYNVGLERALSVYDAAYVVVASAANAPLITADRRLAAAYDRSELIA
ncbi:MAG TPA: type II toxin-antitoxin system VapC family toxin [Gaiellaceae bacterium]|nr:type II toxin-antitoxin system VapC family toxin [Gaiellaceae bacterium]